VTGSANYAGCKESWNNWQNRLNALLGEFNDKNCDPQTLPDQVQQLSDEPYPDMSVRDFMEHWTDGMKRTLDDIGRFVNDPRNLLRFAACDARRRTGPVQVR
jgi:hypothetical protein